MSSAIFKPKRTAPAANAYFRVTAVAEGKMQHFLSHAFSETEPHVRLEGCFSNTLVSLLFTRLYISTVYYVLQELQSAYRKRHSTETAVPRIMSDILQAADSGNVTLLGLLDM